ncbi:CDP-alcohol phosphatidyltransferase family protein [Bifidobacterium aquikefiri]|uniref:Phosphatidylinositol phosphate synthase n=1 Tax=Bifidobacterium aquikefiri TaxID=1653207 RepID=A0A261G6E3_9BIFI|nr:CDP-alcohol phosphatidyltransferase family protein [Bifidobacterium aquikefiri]OZG66990.1 CDP-diacylglycerol--glycerol-3-phosphate 3-phosphatidyltransferase [Bifidobacterium aquikefiri]
MFEHLRRPWKRIIAPIARSLVAVGISANAVTVIGAAGTVVIAIVTGITGWLLAGAVLMAILVAFDSLDGSVAVLTGGGTQFGAFLDSTLDRIADWAVLTGVIIYYFRLLLQGSNAALSTTMTSLWSHQFWAMLGISSALFSIMTSFVTSYARARAEAEGFEAKNGIATRSDRLVIILVGMALTGAGLPVAVMSCFMLLLALLGIVTVYQRIHMVSTSMSRRPSPMNPAHE